jgi:hypothetical protein
MINHIEMNGMDKRTIKETEAKEILHLLALSSGIRIKEEDISVETIDKLGEKTQSARLDESSPTYSKLERIRRYQHEP